jgi:hypothetical protein
MAWGAHGSLQECLSSVIYVKITSEKGKAVMLSNI